MSLPLQLFWLKERCLTALRVESVEISLNEFQISFCDKMSEPLICLLEMHRTGDMENKKLSRDEFLCLLGDCNLPFRCDDNVEKSLDNTNHWIELNQHSYQITDQLFVHYVHFQGPEDDPEVRHLQVQVSSSAHNAPTLLKMLHLWDGDSQINMLQWKVFYT